MSTYVVGDLQGCLQPLLSLLDEVNFNRQYDKLWCTGDLINRGPESLATLRYIHSLGDACVTVLGNHDLHLLAVAYANAPQKKSDTLEEILNAPDAAILLEWLRHRPLIHHQHDFTLVHAGLAPQWTLQQALHHAAEVEACLQSPNFINFLQQMYGNTPEQWSDELTGIERLRCIVNYCTRMRFCYSDGSLDIANKKGPNEANPNTQAWFTLPQRANANDNILFGHWASLACNNLNTAHIFPLDSGCVWGESLTLFRLDDKKTFRCKCSSNKSSAQ